MLTWADAHRRAATLAAQIHADLGTHLDRPVDIFSAIDRLGLVLAFTPLGKVSGLYLPENATPGILLNALHPLTRQRYTAGHELGHHAFQHKPSPDLDLELSLQRNAGRDWTDDEKEAEAFGAWFLMPRRLIRVAMKELGMTTVEGPFDIYQLSLWLGTSYTATANQLATVRIVSEHRARQWIKVPPRDIKVALAREFAPDNLRNDVWWISSRQSGDTVTARAGDRLLLTLDEIPSSGYSWRFVVVPPGVAVIADSFDEEWEPAWTNIFSSESDENAGGSHRHSFLLDIGEATTEGADSLSLVCDYSWDPSADAQQFNLTINRVSPRYGLQIEERELVLA